ncbi:hypothetical protein EZJ19_05210 [Parasulfuritortus cantonensis]|uniref:Sulfotransferase domain-containing protein n=1 Tax=Parasulfuritortus cantonensis TaxID=2528202 RepID=A0A4R1BGI5_9PROT|nr:sulfotransferase domain-containing protein [Parasulfuritortus cantonensis]TCJ16303.1 hypothetical protein EZJ19_05210 [Parasulfuritortus cantonensis]
MNLARLARRLVERPHLPDFLVIGAQKAGTTSLHKYLRRHPGLVGSKPKELHYFDRDIHAGMTLDAYRRHFVGPRGRLYFESTPAYLYAPDAAEHIHAGLPEVKLVVMLRDPVKRAYSAWNHYRLQFEQGAVTAPAETAARHPGDRLYETFFAGRSSFPDFRACLDLELEMIERGAGCEPAILRRGLYLPQLERYWRLFGRDRMLVLGFRDLVERPVDTLAGVTRFIGAAALDWGRFDYRPENARPYAAAMADADARFLAEYYRQANADLFEAIGPLNW